VLPNLASAQTYPTKLVRVIVPVTAGGNVDPIARATAQKLTEDLGQTFVVDNRGGGGGVIGAGFVAKSAPDGYTVMVAPAGTHTINPSLMKLPYDTIRDFTAISIIARGPLVLVAHPSLNVATLQAACEEYNHLPDHTNLGVKHGQTTPHCNCRSEYRRGREILRTGLRHDACAPVGQFGDADRRRDQPRHSR
jgi:tripartite-type tricarboxylate transporter receptor subunit TctC